MKYEFTVNGQKRSVEVEPGTPLLWVLRDTLEMSGTKFGCGMSLCGACTVHVDGNAVRSCTYPVQLVRGRRFARSRGLRVTRSVARSSTPGSPKTWFSVGGANRGNACLLRPCCRRTNAPMTLRSTRR